MVELELELWSWSWSWSGAGADGGGHLSQAAQRLRWQRGEEGWLERRALRARDSLPERGERRLVHRLPLLLERGVGTEPALRAEGRHGSRETLSGGMSGLFIALSATRVFGPGHSSFFYLLYACTTLELYTVCGCLRLTPLPDLTLPLRPMSM